MRGGGRGGAMAVPGYETWTSRRVMVWNDEVAFFKKEHNLFLMEAPVICLSSSQVYFCPLGLPLSRA
ncbi:hypothetical protein Pfo_021837 [Paulownia fortunei]|nr:hypothetical protein Pfo_021837 [Paulownia fortunei]